MLWVFLDESGEHALQAEGGGLKKLTVGGCIASFEAWESLSVDWSDAIAKMGIPMFHMADFEARRKPFEDWTDIQRKARLNTFLGIIGASIRDCWGFTNLARPGDTTESIYQRWAHDVLFELGIYDEQFAIVFAFHPEYGRHNWLLNFLVKQGLGTAIRSCTIAHPLDTCPLQAADLVAYEIRCRERLDFRPKRYPFRKLEELGCVFRLSGAAE
jgi:hypothetical protein